MGIPGSVNMGTASMNARKKMCLSFLFFRVWKLASSFSLQRKKADALLKLSFSLGFGNSLKVKIKIFKIVALLCNTTINMLSCLVVWLDWSDTISQNWHDAPRTMLPIYKELLWAGLTIWVFRLDTFIYIYFAFLLLGNLLMPSFSQYFCSAGIWSRADGDKICCCFCFSL